MWPISVLAERARSEGARSMRAVESATAPFQLSTQAWKRKWNSEGWVVLMWHEE